jgi:thioredoxin-related protein
MFKLQNLIKFIGLLLIVLSISLSHYPTLAQEPVSKSSLGWYSDYEQAKIDAGSSGKYVMLYFSGSDWCKPCIQLNKSIIDTDTFSEYATGIFVPVKLDFPKMKKNKHSKKMVDHNEALAEKYNPNGVFPLLVFLDKNEQMIGFTGFTDVSPGAYVTIIEKIIGQ